MKEPGLPGPRSPGLANSNAPPLKVTVEPLITTGPDALTVMVVPWPVMSATNRPVTSTLPLENVVTKSLFAATAISTGKPQTAASSVTVEAGSGSRAGGSASAADVGANTSTPSTVADRSDFHTAVPPNRLGNPYPRLIGLSRSVLH